MPLPLDPLPATEVDPALLTFYGAPKIGKTTALVQLEKFLNQYNKKSCILEVDRDGKGADFLTCRRIPITSFEDMTTACSDIVKAGRPYSHVILDTITEFEDHCETHATQEYKKSNAGNNFKGRSVLELVGPDFNPGYRWLRLSMQTAMGKLMQCAPYVIVVAHIREKYLKAEDKDKGKSVTEVAVKEIDLSGKIRSTLCVKSDAVGFMYRTSNQDGTTQKLYIDFTTHDFTAAGSRCEHLKGVKMELDWSKIYTQVGKQ